jgi:hypothetical protein
MGKYGGAADTSCHCNTRNGRNAMSHAQRISFTLRTCSRACIAALASLFVALSAYGASSPSSPGKSDAFAVESAAPHACMQARYANGALPCP